jgi:hypothetical protein
MFPRVHTNNSKVQINAKNGYNPLNISNVQTQEMTHEMQVNQLKRPLEKQLIQNAEKKNKFQK